jgi:hypothetical protein
MNRIKLPSPPGNNILVEFSNNLVADFNNSNIKNDVISGFQSSSILQKLLHTENAIKENKSSKITFSKPILMQNGNPIIFPRTVNTLQGKSGVHKSRFVESICACLLRKNQFIDNNLGLETSETGNIDVVYIDTERNLSEQFPYAIQQILIQAGYRIDENPQRLHYTSLMEFDRPARLEALITYIKHLSETIDRNMVVVLDVTTDCIVNFNDSSESLKLIDFMNQTINRFNVTFICLIHENPGSLDKARGHLGTEINNKSSTVIQIGFEKDKGGDNTSLIRLNFLKCRSTKKLESIYMQYSEENKRLELASADDIRINHENKQQKAPMKELIEVLVLALIYPKDRKTLLQELTETFRCGERIIEDRLKEIIESEMEITNRNGDRVKLIKEKGNNNKSVVYYLHPFDS